MVKRFPIRHKTVYPKAVSGEAMAVNTTPIMSSNKIVPFPHIQGDRTKPTPSRTILNFPVKVL